MVMSCSVRGSQSICDLSAIVDNIAGWHAAISNHVLQRSPFDVLHHKKIASLKFADIEQRNDIWMVQPCYRSSFGTQTFPHLCIYKMRVDQLQSDCAVQTRIARPINLTHATGADA